MRRAVTNVGVIAAKLVAAGMLFWALGGTATEHATHSTKHRRAAHAASPSTPAERPAGHGYDYYVLLRWVVCSVAAYSAFRASEVRKKGWAWAFAVVALFFNPILPVHLTRETWGFIDVGVALLFLVSTPVVDLRPPSVRTRDPKATGPRQGEADGVE